jgi:uncharacterized membrane protein YphA (DoxX/SURF4 family)
MLMKPIWPSLSNVVRRTVAGRIAWVGLSFTLMRLTLGVIFLWTGLSKMQQPYDFLSAIYGYELVPAAVGVWIARALPWTEVVVGVCFLSGVWVGGAWCISTCLLGVFAIARYSAVLRGLAIPCGCGRSTEYVTWSDVMVSGILVFISAAGLSAFLLRLRGDHRLA